MLRQPSKGMNAALNPRKWWESGNVASRYEYL